MCIQLEEPETQILCGTLVPKQVVKEKVNSQEKRDSRAVFLGQQPVEGGRTRESPLAQPEGMIAATDSHDEDREQKRGNARRNTVVNREWAVSTPLYKASGPNSG